jgi:hypothetical protein
MTYHTSTSWRITIQNLVHTQFDAKYFTDLYGTIEPTAGLTTSSLNCTCGVGTRRALSDATNCEQTPAAKRLEPTTTVFKRHRQREATAAAKRMCLKFS